MAGVTAVAQIHRPAVRVAVAAILIIAQGAFAQTTVNTTTPKAKKLYDDGITFIVSRQHDKAISSFRKAIQADDEFVDAYIHLGNLELFKQDSVSAEVHLMKAIELLPDHDARPYWDLGHLYMGKWMFSEAEEMFSAYLGFEKARSRETAVRLQKQCAFAVSAMENPLPFVAVNLGPNVNSSDHEYLPSLTADESKLILTRRDTENDEDFYISHRSSDEWQLATNIGRPVSNPGFNEGAQSISPDGLTLYFAADYTDPRLPQNFDIYFTRWTGTEWKEPKRIPGHVNTKHYESQPSISGDGRALYFSSRQPGGLGGKDIWVSYLQEDGTWGYPENLGPNINTPGDEEVPFIHTDNITLYFGSDGHIGMGGSDLYMTTRQEDGSWEKAVNLGYPLNTPGNEGSLFITSDGRNGYFASDKAGGFGGYDLYYFQVPERIRPNRVTYVKATVHDVEGRALEASVELINIEMQRTITKAGTDAKTGEFLVTLPIGHDYGLNVSKEGYLFHSEHFSLSDFPTDSVFLIDITLHRMVTGERIVLRNVFFNTGSYELLEASGAELDRVVKLLTENPNLRVEIGGHTDDVGTVASNQILSEHRAKAVVNYLVLNGIAANRLQSKGYGLSQPIDTNDTETGRARNRRTEIKVIGNE